MTKAELAITVARAWWDAVGRGVLAPSSEMVTLAVHLYAEPRGVLEAMLADLRTRRSKGGVPGSRPVDIEKVS